MSLTMTSAAATINDLGNAHFSTGPLFLVSAGLVTMPLWVDALRTISDFAADAAPVIGCAVGLLTIYKTLNGREKFFSSAADAAGEIAKKPSARSGILLVILGVLSVLAFLLPGKRAEAATPIALLSATPVPSRRKTKDDAGEDGEADAEDTGDGPAWYRAALALRGTHEGTKRKPNRTVQIMFEDCGFPQFKDTTATPWCAAFVGSLVKRAGYTPTNSLMARSFLNWGEKLEKPRLGCVVVMWRGSPTSASGHVGFYAGETASHVLVLGGNQSDSVTVAKFAKSRVLGYRWPRKPSQLRTVKAAMTSAASAAGAAVSTAVVVAESVAPVQKPLQDIGTPAAMSLAAKIGLALAVVACASAIFAAVRRIKDHKERGI